MAEYEIYKIDYDLFFWGEYIAKMILMISSIKSLSFLIKTREEAEKALEERAK